MVYGLGAIHYHFYIVRFDNEYLLASLKYKKPDLHKSLKMKRA